MADIFEEVKEYDIVDILLSEDSIIDLETEIEKGIYSIKGQSYEINDTTTYSNVKYMIVESATNKIIKVVDSTDGSINIDDLPNTNVNIIVMDVSNKYTGKYINDITPVIVPTKVAKIIVLSKIKRNLDYYFDIKIEYFGEPQVNITNTIGLVLEKKTDDLYLVKGKNIMAQNVSFEITLDDYIDGVSNRVSQLVKYGV